MLFSQIARQIGGSGFFFDGDKNAPDDAIKVSNKDVTTSTNLPVAQHYDFTESGELIVLPAPVPDPVEVLAAIKANANECIKAYAKAKRLQIAGTLDDAEIAIMNNKLGIAQAILAGTAAPDEQRVFEMEIEARALNESMDIFCEHILKRGMQFMQAMGVIDGFKHHGIQAVHQAQKKTQVEKLVKDFETRLSAALAHFKEPA